MCACVPHILVQYKAMIDEGYNKPFNEALAWEEELAIESAKQATAQMIEQRRAAVVEKGRSEKQ